MLAQGQPIIGYGLGTAPPAAVSAVPGGRSPTSAGLVGFTRSAAFGLLLGIAAVAYIDGRVLPRKRG